MYPVERFLLTLKNYVSNRAHPEGSIAEAYLSNECLTFCSRYLDGVETRFNRPLRNDDEDDGQHCNESEENLITPLGRPLGRTRRHMTVNVKKRKRVRRIKLDSQSLVQAHRYILFNTTEMPKRKRLSFVRVQPNNNEVEPSEPVPNGSNDSDSNHQHVRQQTESWAPSPPPRKLRGPTLMSHIWELEEGVKVNVVFDANCHPVGKEGCTLTRFLGTVARKSDVMPITYMEWRDLPQIYKDDIWKIIESKFHIEERRKEQIKNWIMTDVNEKWKSYKNELKNAGFDPLLTVDEMYDKINDPQIDKEQFQVLVDYWRSEKGKKISKQNKENRQKLEEPHCLGTKTFARFINEKESSAEGRKPSRAELYIHSRTKKGEGTVSEKASQVMEQLQNCMSESSTSALEDTTSWQDDVSSKVKGSDKKGRVCCLKKVPTSKKSIPSTSTNSNIEQRLSEVENILGGLVMLMKKRFPNENVTDILQAANQLATANRLDREVSDANSGQVFSRNNHSSSHSSHHMLSR